MSRKPSMDDLRAVAAKLPLPLRYDADGQILWGTHASSAPFHLADLRGYGRCLSDAACDDEAAAKRQDEIGEALVRLVNSLGRILKDGGA